MGWNSRGRAGDVEERSGELGDVADHVGIAELMTGSLGEFVPNVEPVAVVFVDALATDFDFDVLDKDMAEPVQPPETLVVRNGNGW